MQNQFLRSLGYEVLSQIGIGTSGKVKLATSSKHPNNVAIKIMSLRLVPPVFVKKLLPRELAILRKVEHPHIIKVHEIHEMPNKGRVFVVMEAAKMDLQQRISVLGHVPIHQAKIWFSQLVSAVKYLHEQDIVHRDIKCKNVLLTEDDQIKLADFGLARDYKGYPDLAHTYCCTPDCSAPEVLAKGPYNPKQSDIWSLGLILYNMVTGTNAFKGKSWNDIMNVQKEPLEFPKDVPVEEPCRAFIMSMLKYNPLDRPSVTEVANHPWLQEQDPIQPIEDKVHSSPALSPLIHVNISVGSSVTSGRADVNIGCKAFFAAIKKAAHRVAVPIVRNSRTLRKRMRKVF